MIGRRSLLGCLLLTACGHRVVVAPGVPPQSRLKLDPLVDLAPAAGLVWLLDTRAEELLASPVLAPGVALVLPANRFDAFAEQHGGIDLRHVTRLIVAQYPRATLTLARVLGDNQTVTSAVPPCAAIRRRRRAASICAM